MQITHEDARRLIQFDADEVLKGTEKNLLENHLESCLECRAYASQIKQLELVLSPIMQRRWNRPPLPRHRDVSLPKKSSRIAQNAMLATRIAAMGILCIAFLFNIWQFTQSAGGGPDLSTAGIPPVPTPSVYTTTTGDVNTQNCQQVPYRVQESDTLERIAEQFSVTRSEIMTANDMKVETIHPSMNLWIPVCGSMTPGTSGSITTTFTPLLGPTTSTPVNAPTQ